jgi:tetrahydromethanopterin S-methyltransferase subunit B
MYGLKKYGFVIGLVFMAMLSNAQTIAGKLSFLAHQKISLEVF